MLRSHWFALCWLPWLLANCGDEKGRALRALSGKGIAPRADHVHDVIARGDEESLRELLICGVFPRQADESGKTPLVLACERSDFRMVRLLLAHGAIEGETSTDRGSALAIAAERGDIAIAKTLLDHGAPTKVLMSDDDPLLLWCIKHGRYIIASALLDHGADVHGTDHQGRHAIACAMARKQRALVERLLILGADAGAIGPGNPDALPSIIQCWQLGWDELLPQLIRSGADLHARDAHGHSLVDIVISQGREKELARLLDLGLDPNTCLADGTPLLIWSLQQEERLSLKLLEKGADPNTRDHMNISILLHAIHQSKRAVCEALIRRKVQAAERTVSPFPLPPVIVGAMHHGWHDLIESLVACGAGVNTMSQSGLTAADLALNRGDVVVFQQLVRLGATPPLSSWNRELLTEVKQSRWKRLETMLAAGIRPAPHTEETIHLIREAMAAGETQALEVLLGHQIHSPSMFLDACEAGRVDHLLLLQKHGIGPQASRGDALDLPLHAAIRSGSVETVKFLLDQGHDVHALGRENQTPLVCAIARQHHSIVRLLLQYKADPNRPLEAKAHAAFLALIPSNSMRWYLLFDRNLTPLMLAAQTGDVEMARTLMKHGAKLGVCTAVNKTWPLNFACRQGDVPMIRLMLRKNPYVERQCIHVDLGKQEARLVDSCGNVIFSTRISSGKKGFSTQRGTFVITNKHRTWNSTIYDGASMPCFQRLSCGDFGFHQGVVPGYPASHGCLRVPYGQAQRLFELTQIGDRVVIE